MEHPRTHPKKKSYRGSIIIVRGIPRITTQLSLSSKLQSIATATDSIQLSCSQSSQSMDSNQSGEVEKEAVAN